MPENLPGVSTLPEPRSVAGPSRVPHLGLSSCFAPTDSAVAANGAGSHSLPPPGGCLGAQEARFVSAREEEVHHLIFPERCAVRPAIVFFQMGGLLVIVNECDFFGRTLNHRLRLEREGSSRRRRRRHLICDLRQKKDKHEGCGECSYSFHTVNDPSEHLYGTRARRGEEKPHVPFNVMGSLGII